MPTSPDRVLYGRKDSEGSTLGGDPITIEEACVSTQDHTAVTLPVQKLKVLCWGNSGSIPRADWIKQGFVFRESEELSAYGLQVKTGATKAFQLVLQVTSTTSGLYSVHVLQAYLLKHLMFEARGRKGGGNKKFAAM